MKSRDLILHRAGFPRRPWWTRIGHVIAWTAMACQIRRERNQLLGMSDAQLRDIGVTREEAYREAGRVLRDIPSNRLRR